MRRQSRLHTNDEWTEDSEGTFSQPGQRGYTRGELVVYRVTGDCTNIVLRSDVASIPSLSLHLDDMLRQRMSVPLSPGARSFMSICSCGVLVHQARRRN